eukprot:COSAG01_NODE_4347_length_5116_cov_11.269683_9_plen_56_part_01
MRIEEPENWPALEADLASGRLRVPRLGVVPLAARGSAGVDTVDGRTARLSGRAKGL